MDSTTELRFRRERPGVYFAKDNRFQFCVRRDQESGTWLLEVRELKHLSALRMDGKTVVKAMSHAVGQPVIDGEEARSKAEAVAMAVAYSGFENPYSASLHGGYSRITAAVLRVYERSSEGQS